MRKTAAKWLGITCAVAALAPPATLGAPTRSATVTADVAVGADGNCYVTDIAMWSGYQVNRLRHVFYRRTPAGPVWDDFSTTGYAQGETRSSGSFASASRVPAFAGETWFVHAIFRSNGGAHLAETDSADTVIPATCPARP